MPKPNPETIGEKILQVTRLQAEIAQDAREWYNANQHLSRSELNIKLAPAKFQAVAFCFGEMGDGDESLCDETCDAPTCIIKLLQG